jgi:membrane protein YqaA with SNARE-associated domain
MLRRLYDWTMQAAAGPEAERMLGLVAFAESSFFPVPPDVMIVPMVLARPEAAWRIAGIATIASVAGGLFGYLIGALLFETVGRFLIDLYGYAAEFARFEALYADYGLWIVLIGGFTPFPYKVVTIASGVASYPLLPFILGSLATRGARFFIEAALLYAFGPPIRAFIERWLGWLATAFVVLLIGGFAALRLI